MARYLIPNRGIVDTGGDIGSAFKAGTSWGSDLVSQLNAAIAGRKRDEIVNRLMNTEDPTLGTHAPRAALVSAGVSPTTGKANVIPAGTETAGGRPFSGGVQEYAVRHQLLSDALDRAKMEDYLAQAHGTGRYAKTSGLTPYQQLQEQHYQQELLRKQQEAEQKQQEGLTKKVQDWQNKNAQTVETLAKEINTKHGGGAAESLWNAWSTGTLKKGNMLGDGTFEEDPNGLFYQAPGQTSAFGVPLKPVTVKTFEFDDYMARKKAIEDAGGRLLPTPKALPVVPSSDAGTVTNTRVQPINPSGVATRVQPINPSGVATRVQPIDTVPTPTTQEEFDAIPSGSQFVDGDGMTKVKP